MSNPYDIELAFSEIEDELIDSMIRNMRRHRVEEVAEKKHWEMWQALQLKSLEEYKQKNQKKFTSWFSDINKQIEEVIQEANKNGSMSQEIKILEAIKKGFRGTKKVSSTMQAEFFKLNERKLEALISATVNDMQKAEVAILRKSEDQYRQVIYNAQVYANTGAGTYEKAVDMATKDMLSAGLNCVEYANGARHTLKDYADMAIKTASKRAYLQGEGAKRQEWGISTVIVNKRGNPCPKCLPFCGKVLIDDVWSGGSRKDGPYPLMSKAVAAGLYHPRCKDSHTTYFPDITTADDKWTEEELAAIGEEYKAGQKKQYAKRQAEKYGRLAEYSMDEENRKKYSGKKKIWSKMTDIIDTLSEHEPVPISKLDTQYKKDIINILGIADKRIQNIFLKYSDQVLFVNEKTLGRSVNNRRGIRINALKDKNDVRGKYTATFHEIGHSIDRTAGGISYKNPAFKKALNKDFKEIVDLFIVEYNVNKEEAYSLISQAIREDKHHAVSDIIGGLTNNECVGKYRHATKYWSKPNKIESEAFAHFFEAYARTDVEKIEYLSQMFPTAEKEFLRLVENENETNT